MATAPTERKRASRTAKQTQADAPLIRTSERTTFKRCRWEWDRSYNDRLTPVVDAPALRFGTLVHKALEKRYPPGIKRGPKPAPVFEKLFAAELAEAEKSWGFRDADGEWADACELGVNMLENYVDTYGRDEEWRVIASEMTFRVPVMTPPAPDGSGMFMEYVDGLWVPCTKEHPLFYYVGTMDGVWQNRMDGGVRVNDYKTTKGDVTQEALGKLLLDEQGTAYWTWGVDWLEMEKILKPKQQQALDGMLYTFLRKAKKDERPVDSEGYSLNKDGSRSLQQPGAYFHRELVYRDREQCDRARRRAIYEYADMMDVREGRKQPYKSPGMAYPSMQCKACAFFDLCELDEIGQDYGDLQAVAFKDWDPYADHEIEEEGKY